MTITHIQGITVLALDDKGTILEDADLVIADGRIAHLGKAPDELAGR